MVNDLQMWRQGEGAAAGAGLEPVEIRGICGANAVYGANATRYESPRHLASCWERCLEGKNAKTVRETD
jgi:hypothetical protein